MKYFDRFFDWLETRPMYQIFIGVLLALFILAAISECT